MAPVHEEADYMRRVVVVDDDELSRHVVARRLTRWGFTPVVFGQAEAVLCYLQTHDACALVSDLEMPECDGLSLARAVLALRPVAEAILDRLERCVHGRSGSNPATCLAGFPNIDAPGGTFRTTTLPAPMRA